VKRIQIPTWSLSVNEVVKWEDLTIRRYPIFDRAKERCAISMAIGEDDEIFAVLKAASELPPNTGADIIAVPGGTLTRGVFADLYGVIAGRQLVPSTFLLHPRKYADIQKWNSTDLDILVETGQFGVLYGSRLIVSTRLPNGTGANRVYCTTTPDKLGRIPERKAVEVKIFDNVNETAYNIVAWEQIGIGIFNPAGVSRTADF